MADERDYVVEGLNDERGGRGSGKGKIIWVVLGLLLVVAVAVAVVLFKDKLGGSQSGIAMNDASVVEELKRIMDVPANETPSIATVVDVTKLAGQPFFAKAMTNDKLVLYTEAKKAILYRPSTNKIIEVMPLVLDAPTEAGAVAAGTNQLN